MVLNTATDAQIKYINTLKNTRSIESSPDAISALEAGRQLWRSGRFTVEAASNVIQVLKAQPMLPKPLRTKVPEGMHAIGDKIYRVQLAVHGSGVPYSKLLVVNDDGEGVFKYDPDALYNLSEATLMTLDQAKVFGKLYGVCCVCGRTLTDEESIAEGIGPVCAGRFRN